MRLLLIMLIALMLFCNNSVASNRDHLIAFSKNLKSLEGAFSQDTYDNNGKHQETSTGKVFFSSPNLFRWEYEKPYVQIIIADGSNIWVYDPDLQQATRQPQQLEEQNNPLAVLVDASLLDRHYLIEDVEDSDGKQWLRLKSKNTSENAYEGFESILLGFEGDNFVSMKLVDSLGQRTDIRFEQWQRNLKIPPDTFRFTLEKDVDIVGAG